MAISESDLNKLALSNIEKMIRDPLSDTGLLLELSKLNLSSTTLNKDLQNLFESMKENRKKART